MYESCTNAYTISTYVCVNTRKLCCVTCCVCICTGQAEVMTELEKRSAEVAMEKMEKDNLKRKIMEMEESLVGWELLEWYDR